ncbi:hypothetical protein L291_3317 [Acinetobacter guillouiae MSP4-18]|nr:hypothetical protein L291_3317 [Acinetobacter guillouiae MSP4-18]
MPCLLNFNLQRKPFMKCQQPLYHSNQQNKLLNFTYVED